MITLAAIMQTTEEDLLNI